MVNTQLIDSFEYEYPTSEKIVGIITSGDDGVSFIFRPERSRALALFELMLKAELNIPKKKKW
jgi:hypothetical protein